MVMLHQMTAVQDPFYVRKLNGTTFQLVHRNTGRVDACSGDLICFTNALRNERQMPVPRITALVRNIKHEAN